MDNHMKTKHLTSMFFVLLSIVFISCPPNLQIFCYKHDDCVDGYLCNLVSKECIKCPNCIACTTSDECDDGNICTNDSCPQSCICQIEYNKIPCGDDLFCNGQEICDGKGNCNQEEPPCGELICNEQKDACMCDNHADCMQNHLCDLEEKICIFCPDCIACTNAEACNDDNVCTDDLCPASGICSHKFNINTCDDNIFCNGSDVCDGQGNCIHKEDVCTNMICDEELDLCEEVDWKTLSPGGMHTCGLTKLGNIFCWGYDGNGQLGIEPGNHGYQAPFIISTSSIPNNVKFIQVSAGYTHTCAITNQGSAYCWGADLFGALGNGLSIGDASQPFPINTSMVSGSKIFKQISAGYHHTCGVTTEGDCYCWGMNNKGQLGVDREISMSEIPLKISTKNLSDPKTLSFVSAGFTHSCGITTEGKVFCWGDNESGTLGNNSTENQSIVPVEVDTFMIEGSKEFISVSTGWRHTCGVSNDKIAYCWGGDYSGALGNGESEQDKSIPSKVDTSTIVGDKTFTSISTGWYHICGVTSDHVIYCWGQNMFGQLGNGQVANSEVPIKIHDGNITGNKSMIQVYSGSTHTCGLSAENIAYCWGSDSEDQLGDGGIANYSYIPTPLDTSEIKGSDEFLSISAGIDHTCGITIDNTAYCWGSNIFGKLGSGPAYYTSQLPVLVDITHLPNEEKFFRFRRA